MVKTQVLVVVDVWWSPSMTRTDMPRTKVFLPMGLAAIALALGGLLAPVLGSHFDPHPLHPASSKAPFFEGWFTRVVDHANEMRCGCP